MEFPASRYDGIDYFNEVLKPEYENYKKAMRQGGYIPHDMDTWLEKYREDYRYSNGGLLQTSSKGVSSGQCRFGREKGR